MRVAVATGVSGPEDVEFVQAVERVGASSVWVAEAYKEVSREVLEVSLEVLEVSLEVLRVVSLVALRVVFQGLLS